MMRLLSRARSLWRALTSRGAFEAEMEDEYRHHIELRTRDLLAAGLSPAEAARRARLEFGSVESMKESGRESRGLRIFDELAGDARYGLRTLLRSPGFALVAVLTLALGIGANTAIFSALDAVLLRPLPFFEPDRLVVLNRVEIPIRWGDEDPPQTQPSIIDARALDDAFTHVAAYAPGGLNLTGSGAPRRIRVGVVTTDFFAALGVPPQRGRTFAAEEGLPEGGRVAVVSHAFWRSHLGAADDLSDRSITLNGVRYAVVGVTPRGFAFPEDAEVWLPLTIPFVWGSMEPFRQYLPSRVIARLAPGTSIERAQSRVHALYAAYDRPDRRQNVTAAELVHPLRPLFVGSHRSTLLVLLGATALVLLVACANIAHLLLSRGAARRRELALRASLGATPARVVRQLLVESLLLAGLGGGLGIALGFAGIQFLDVLVPPALAGAVPVRVDARVLGFALLLTIVTGIVFGLFPALGAGRTKAGAVLKSGVTGVAGRGPSNRLGQVFVVGEVALATMLLVGSGLMLRSLHALLTTESGVEPARVATLEVALASREYPDIDTRRRFYENVIDRLAAIPQVEAAGIINELPLRGEGGIRFTVYPEGRPPATQTISNMAQDLRVTPGYFDAMGISILVGRAPRPQRDTLRMGEVAINRILAEQYWPGQSPIGQRLELPGGTRFEIVGVVGDVRVNLASEPYSQAYYSLLDTPYYNAAIIARGRVPARRLARLLENAVRAVAPDQAVYNVRTMEQVIAGAIAPRRVNTVLISAFGLLALGLAAIGVYGVIAFSVARRTHEIGIRMALGAQRGQVRQAVMRDALALAFAGTVTGIGAAWMLSRVLSSLLYGITTRDPVAFISAPLVLLAAATFAALVPANRATRVDPARAIRGD